MPTNDLIKKFHTLCSTNGLNEDYKRALLSSYGVESTKDLKDKDIKDAINKLMLSSTKNVEADKMRKKVIAAIGGYFRLTKYEGGIEAIKTTACRAANCDNFNKIPVSVLKQVYYVFSKKCRTVKDTEQAVKDLASEIINVSLN